MSRLNRDTVVEIILDAMRQLNLARLPDEQLEVNEHAIIFGPGSCLDSLGLVALVLDVEDALSDLGVQVALSDERAMSQKRSPFRTVPDLASYIESLQDDDSHD
jgi:acyl carrier protein